MSLKILIIDDEEEICLSLQEFFEFYDYSCAYICSPRGVHNILREFQPDMVLLDLCIPGKGGLDLIQDLHAFRENIPIIVISGHATIQDTVKAMKMGAHNLYTKPVDMETLLKEIRGLEQHTSKKQGNSSEDKIIEEVITQDPDVLKIMNLAKQVAQTDATVLITGESGTGKELVVNTIHNRSSRAGQPLIKVNCAAISETLLESEIFGHEKGAFTDAREKKIGLFEQADKGTIFLDEIGDMSLSTQAKMLRILQDKRYTRVGGTRLLEADCRIIAATNKDFDEEIKKERFREDLYYRLSAITLKLPPLRKRPSDLAILTRHFLRCFNLQYEKSVEDFSPEVWKIIYKHSWPGNIRELKNFIQRLVIFSQDSVIEMGHVPEQYKAVLDSSAPAGSSLYDELTGDAARASIIDALTKSRGVKSKAAELLGVDRKTLYSRMKKFNLS